MPRVQGCEVGVAGLKAHLDLEDLGKGVFQGEGGGCGACFRGRLSEAEALGTLVQGSNDSTQRPYACGFICMWFDLHVNSCSSALMFGVLH